MNEDKKKNEKATTDLNETVIDNYSSSDDMYDKYSETNLERDKNVNYDIKH